MADDRRRAGWLPGGLHPAAVGDAPAQRGTDQDHGREGQAGHTQRRRQERLRRPTEQRRIVAHTYLNSCL